MNSELKKSIEFHKEWEVTKAHKLFKREDMENVVKYRINVFMATTFHDLQNYVEKLYDPNYLIFSEDSWTVSDDGWYCGLIMNVSKYYKDDNEYVFMRVALNSGQIVKMRFCMYDEYDPIYAYLKERYDTLSLDDLNESIVWIRYSNRYKGNEVLYSSILKFQIIEKDALQVYLKVSDLLGKVEEMESTESND